jgi:very-short-patch-repair endonuclease
MIYNYNKKLVGTAQSLRKRMTPEEKHLWYDFLKRLPVNVNRQKNIGDFIVDFYIASARIVIELDGSFHNLPYQKADDAKRDAELQQLHITVLRYTNIAINKNFNWVCNDILKHLGLTFDDLKPRK